MTFLSPTRRCWVLYWSFCLAIFPSFPSLSVFLEHCTKWLGCSLLNMKDWLSGIFFYLLKSIGFLKKLDIPFWLDGFYVLFNFFLLVGRNMSHWEVHSISILVLTVLKHMCTFGVPLFLSLLIFLLWGSAYEPGHVLQLKRKNIFKTRRSNLFLVQTGDWGPERVK